ncbi:hypothetical protein ACN20G_34075 (plasmid) [Streptomyces sp. BI20]|uniref:hypothetical protein n=1 Tax=Streptomyces sp. BI20 TaxID=3403460 RepID=UPI003C739D0B
MDDTDRRDPREMRSATPFLVIGCAVLLVGGTVVSYFVTRWARSAAAEIVTPDTEAMIRVGETEPSVRSKLPRENPDTGELCGGRGPVAPVGSQCAWYLYADPTARGSETNVLRLAFKDGRLIEKLHYPVTATGMRQAVGA